MREAAPETASCSNLAIASIRSNYFAGKQLRAAAFDRI
jgi:hypothetical protein